MGGCVVAERIGGELLMADYLVTDTELTSVADAIRTKGGTSAALEWPGGYEDAIAAISGGGGGVECATVSIFGVSGMAPSNIYYTDENMTMQHVTTGTVEDVLMPIGSIISCYGSEGPAMPASNIGVSTLFANATARTLNAAYVVTG